MQPPWSLNHNLVRWTKSLSLCLLDSARPVSSVPCLLVGLLHLCLVSQGEEATSGDSGGGSSSYNCPGLLQCQESGGGVNAEPQRQLQGPRGPRSTVHLCPHLSLRWDFGCGLARLVPAWFLRLLPQPSNESVNYSISCSNISSAHILLPVCFCCLLLRTLTSIGLGTRGVECYKPRAGKQGAGCVLEVGGAQHRHIFPAGNLRMLILWVRNRGIHYCYLLNLDRQIAHPYRVLREMTGKKIQDVVPLVISCNLKWASTRNR